MSAAAATAPGGEHRASSEDTPAVRQYWAAKQSHPDCLVMFRMGDFFELFGDDAERAAPILGVALTARPFGRSGRIAMCGVPHLSLETYARKLLEAGVKVAVCDQIEEPRKGKLVARRVVRVLSPGTLVEEGFLSPESASRCVALYGGQGATGLAALDVSTGQCELMVVTDVDAGPRLVDRLVALETAELLQPVGQPLPEGSEALGAAVSIRPRSDFDADRGRDLAQSAGLEVPETGRGQLALGALGALAAYCRLGELAINPGFLRLSWREEGRVMGLDPATSRNLDLVPPPGGGPSLLRLLDRTLTAPGARCLRSWLLEPLCRLGPIARRQEAVAELLRAPQQRRQIRSRLHGCSDLERLLGRCAHGLAGPRDLAALATTLERLPELTSALSSSSSELLGDLVAGLGSPAPETAALLRRALVDAPPAQARDGGYIRAGFDPELERIRESAAGAREYLSRLEATERERTGIRTLKVGYNRVFGYYIEVRHSAREPIPPEYLRRQTLVGSERFVTAELREQENVVLTARERANLREQECLRRLLQAVVADIPSLGRAASALAEVDAIQSLAEVGASEDWVMPQIDQGLGLSLAQARHPLVESGLAAGQFVPNDIDLDGEAERIWLLTGPNMAGKSTFLRQVAVVCLLGQLGAPVPCARARWGLVDRIFTRVGAHDDIASGRSTFMVEMEEVALILARATPRSLVVLDELGRGTSTYDGMSIAQAVLEHLHDAPSSPRRVLFATHFHELTALERSLPGLRNHRVDVAETDSGGDKAIAFLHRVVPGGADRSYGIHVARLAGLPAPVLVRADAILAEREAAAPLGAGAADVAQLDLPLAQRHPMLEDLGRLELESMTPLEALQKIAEWQRQVEVRR
ncbi:MAG: DNA mismatch repair protein MutS [Candidatus Dormibacteria bacterium]